MMRRLFQSLINFFQFAISIIIRLLALLHNIVQLTTKMDSGAVVGLGIIGAFLIVMVIFCCCICCNRRRNVTRTYQQQEQWPQPGKQTTTTVVSRPTPMPLPIVVRTTRPQQRMYPPPPTESFNQQPLSAYPPPPPVPMSSGYGGAPAPYPLADHRYPPAAGMSPMMEPGWKTDALQPRPQPPILAQQQPIQCPPALFVTPQSPPPPILVPARGGGYKTVTTRVQLQPALVHPVSPPKERARSVRSLRERNFRSNQRDTPSSRSNGTSSRTGSTMGSKRDDSSRRDRRQRSSRK